MAGIEGADSNVAVVAREFEFDEAQNATMRGLSATMRFVGVINLIGAAVYGISALIHLAKSAVHADGGNIAMFLVTGSMCALLYFTGTWTTHAAGSFGSIATTVGSDIANLMSALTDLLKLYRLQRVLIVVTLSVAAVGVVMMIVALLTGGSAAGPAA